MKVFLNPGHCLGLDSGACGYGVTEAETTFKIACRVRDYLLAVNYEVYLFQFDGLEEIVTESNLWRSDLFVSIHCNALNGTARGTETFYCGSYDGERLAHCIQNQILAKLPTVNRGVKEYGFYVIKHTDCPAVLVETAFIDNVDDNTLLVEREDDFARAIALGITDYVKAYAS